jgi:NAD-dependent SIR2 family protein deacetylase
LHQRAGSRNVIELHGNINRTKCFEIVHSRYQTNVARGYLIREAMN